MAANAQAAMTTLFRRGQGWRNGVFKTSGGRRDIEEACGYLTELDYSEFFEAYDKVDVAKRVVETYPDYTWIRNPEVYETETEEVVTPFEKSLAQHIKRNRPFSELRKLDILAGIGKFGLLVLGVNDGKALHLPLAPRPASQGMREILYYRAYTEGEVKIIEWETNLKSVRYGKPVMYEVRPAFGAASEIGKGTGVSATPISDKSLKPVTNPYKTSFKVHHTRCIHFADNALCGDVYGTERLRQVFNRLIDITKIAGGSAEMFWQGAFSGIAFEMDPEAEISENDKNQMRSDIDNYINKLQRTLLLQGVKANPLSPSIASPIDHLDVQLTLISIASRIPKRILTGSEMGKLASTQDSASWALQITTRRNNIAVPYLLEEYVRFCIRNGVLRSPQKEGEYGFSVVWCPIAVTTKEEQAKAADGFTAALEKYCVKGLYHAIAFSDYLYHIHGYTADEAHTLAKAFDKKAFEKIREQANAPKPPSPPREAPREEQSTESEGAGA